MNQNQDIDLFDSSRNRAVPVRLWLPTGEPRAWIIFSVGFGGERSGYAYLGRAWARSGLATAVVEHVGSNLETLKALPGRTRQERNQEVVKKVADPAELADRPRDLALVHAHLAARWSQLPLGLAGHSFGSYTALASLGLPTVPRLPELAPEQRLRPDSCLLISPQPPGRLFSSRALGSVGSPSLILTGTEDATLDGSEDYRARAAVYDHLPQSLRNLVVLPGVEHMAFAGIGLGLASTLKTVEELTCRWWESTLWGDSTPPLRASQLAVAAGGEGEFR
jgi:hypothetical protein